MRHKSHSAAHLHAPIFPLHLSKERGKERRLAGTNSTNLRFEIELYKCLRRASFKDFRNLEEHSEAFGVT